MGVGNNNNMLDACNSNTDARNSNTMSNAYPIQLNPSTMQVCRQCTREEKETLLAIVLIEDVLTLLLMILMKFPLVMSLPPT